MVFFDIVHGQFARVGPLLFRKVRYRYFFLKYGCSVIFLVLQNVQRRGSLPHLLVTGRFNAVSGQPFCNAARSFSGEELRINSPHDFRLLLIDNKLPIGTLVVTEEIGIAEADLSVREGLSSTP